MRKALFLLATALVLAFGPNTAQGAETSAVAAKIALTLRVGATMAVPLTEAAQRVIVTNPSVATAHISGDKIAVIKGRGPGIAKIAIQNNLGRVTNTFDVVIRQVSDETTGSLGPQSYRVSLTPDRSALMELMGPDFTFSPKLGLRPLSRLPQGPALKSAGPTRPPIGWQQFCSAQVDECAVQSLEAMTVTLDSGQWSQLNDINNRANRRIKPMSDLKHHGVPEYWSYPMDGYGDCEDYVLLKRRLLIEAGWPRQALLITVVRDQQNEGHAVLTVRTDHGDLVLDNQRARIVNWTETGYRFVKRQSAENPNLWVALRDLESRLEAAATP